MNLIKELKTYEEITEALDAGKLVKCDNGHYTAIKDSIGQYLIKFDHIDYVIGLGRPGKLNGTDFWTYTI